MKNDQHEDSKETATGSDKDVSSWWLFLPEGFIALGLALASPFIAGFYFNEGLAGQGVLTLVTTILASAGCVKFLSTGQRWLAWACMVGLIVGTAMIHETVPHI